MVVGIDVDDSLVSSSESFELVKKKYNIDCILFGDKIKSWKEVLEYIKRKEQ